jgi:mono/diheme cytochrome c family protein
MTAQAGTLGTMAPIRSQAASKAKTHSARSAYILHCAGCHGLDGRGVSQAQVPDLRAMADFLKVPGGREFLIKVPGVMGSALSDAEIAEVTNWMLTDGMGQSSSGPFQPYTEKEVREARLSPLVDVMQTRQVLVNLLRAASAEAALSK